MSRSNAVLVLPCEGAPPCPCGKKKVAVYFDGISTLIDNMGCELGLEMLDGPLCPTCESSRLEEARRKGQAK